MASPSLTLQQQVALCQQIARITQAKLPLADQLDAMVELSGPEIAQASQQVRQSLLEGKSLTDALVKDDSPDSRILSACLSVGQSSNCLDKTLEHWTSMHIANRRSCLALRAAMLYPSALILIALIAVGWTAWSLIPEIEKTYQQFEIQEPIWLSWIFATRQHFGWLIAGMILLMAAPLLYWQWRRSRTDQHGVPRSSAKRFRLQALASRLASLQVAADQPLSEALPLCAAALGTPREESQKAFQELRLHRPLGAMPVETTMVLASLHCGIITSDQAVVHCDQIGQFLDQQAELLDQQECRWLPVLVALVVAALTLIVYGLLVYLPWVALLTKVV